MEQQLAKYKNPLFLNNLIQQMIEDLVDPETGEINEDAWKDVESLQIAKEEAVVRYGMGYKKLLAEVEFWKSEEKRIASTRKVMENIAERIKFLLKKSIDEGEKIKSPDVEISWRKSESVEIDEFADLASLHKQFPDLFAEVITYKPDKMAIKDHIKKGVGIKGVSIQQKNNITIK